MSETEINVEIHCFSSSAPHIIASHSCHWAWGRLQPTGCLSSLNSVSLPSPAPPFSTSICLKTARGREETVLLEEYLGALWWWALLFPRKFISQRCAKNIIQESSPAYSCEDYREEKAIKPFCSSLCNEKKRFWLRKFLKILKQSVNSTEDLCISRVELPLALLWWQMLVKVYTSLVILIAALGAGQKPPLAFLT